MSIKTKAKISRRSSPIELKKKNAPTPSKMNSSNPTSKKNGPEVKDATLEGEGPGNVDKIRDILFGSQMRDYDSRFSRFEERLLKETIDPGNSNRK